MTYRTPELKSLRQYPHEVQEALLRKLVSTEVLEAKEIYTHRYLHLMVDAAIEDIDNVVPRYMKKYQLTDTQEVPAAYLEELLQETIAAQKTTSATVNAFLDDALATVAAEACAAEREKLLEPLKQQYANIEGEYKKTKMSLEFFPKWEEIQLALTPQMYKTLNLEKSVLRIHHILDGMSPGLDPSQKGKKWEISIAEYNESGTECLHLFLVLTK